MSSDNETDSAESYQTDDSDINFIPGYIMECPKRENSSSDSRRRRKQHGHICGRTFGQRRVAGKLS